MYEKNFHVHLWKLTIIFFFWMVIKVSSRWWWWQFVFAALVFVLGFFLEMKVKSVMTLLNCSSFWFLICLFFVGFIYETGFWFWQMWMCVVSYEPALDCWMQDLQVVRFLVTFLLGLVYWENEVNFKIFRENTGVSGIFHSFLMFWFLFDQF